MRLYWWKLLCLTGVLSAFLPGGCRSGSGRGDGSMELTSDSRLGARIGSVAKVAGLEPMSVEGIGLVGGLAGTGSANCPPAIRPYLKQYILSQTPAGGYTPDELIDSKNTAVVQLQGAIPPAAARGSHFDVRVWLLPGSEASSLHGGWLLKAELKAAGTGGAGRTVAIVEGPVFIDKIDASRPDVRSGYILGGGRVADEYGGVLTLRKGDYLLASRIRNRLNERYGPNIAEAISPTAIGFRIPAEYSKRRLRFIAMVGATYLDRPELADIRADAFVRQLATSSAKEESEIALEAIGRASLQKLRTLLQAPDEEVRLRAARCMLNLGDDRGFEALREIAVDSSSQRRLEALNAITTGARRNDAAVAARLLLNDRDPAVVVGAYECLRELDDFAIRQERVGRSFYVEQVAASSARMVYVSRSGDPRIVLFGAPLRCRDNLFLESPDRMVIINSQAGQPYVSVMRKYASRPGVMGPLNATFDLADIIRTLGTEPAGTSEGGVSGLGVPYSDIIVLVQQLAARNAVAAQFRAGPLPEPGPIIKK